jgi:hypothetical protein
MFDHQWKLKASPLSCRNKQTPINSFVKVTRPVVTGGEQNHTAHSLKEAYRPIYERGCNAPREAGEPNRLFPQDAGPVFPSLPRRSYRCTFTTIVYPRTRQSGTQIMSLWIRFRPRSPGRPPFLDGPRTHAFATHVAELAFEARNWHLSAPNGSRRLHPNDWNRQRCVARNHVSRATGQRSFGAGSHLRKDAEKLHPHCARGQGGARNVTLRSQ